MIRKSISCALAGLLTVVPALALFGLFGQPGSQGIPGVVVLGLIFCFTVGVVWLGSEVSEILQSNKPSWEEQYAQNIYSAFVASPDLGNITALKLKIPTALHAVYQNKAVLQRELISFVALASVSSEESGLRPVLREYENLLVKKMAERGLQMSGEQMAHAAFDDARALDAQPFKWAQEWLAEFGDNAKDNYILFAEHWLKLFKAYSAGIENTRPR
jgi:hypothetical protein